MSKWWHTIKGAGAISTQGPGFTPALHHITYGKKKKKRCDEE
jgi:hypothetical protein